MLLDKWIGDGCGFDQICTQSWDKCLSRYEFMLQFNQFRNGSWPFVHSFTDIDPLIDPFVNWMSKRVKTITSCQGYSKSCPYVMFVGDPSLLEDAIQWNVKGGWYWNQMPIIYTGVRDGQNMFIVQFYDTISLIKFNLEFLGISVKQQFGRATFWTEFIPWLKD